MSDRICSVNCVCACVFCAGMRNGCSESVGVSIQVPPSTCSAIKHYNLLYLLFCPMILSFFVKVIIIMLIELANNILIEERDWKPTQIT